MPINPPTTMGTTPTFNYHNLSIPGQPAQSAQRSSTPVALPGALSASSVAPMQALSSPAPQQSTAPTTSNNPQFSDIQKLLQPSTGVSADTQGILNTINSQRDYYAGLATSAAQGLAAERGQSGSSTEQFGVQQALAQTNNAALTATQGALTADQANQQAKTLALAGYTSDQIASIVNQGQFQQSLTLQQQLGTQANNLGYANINSANQIAKGNQTNQLIGTGAQLLLGGGLGGGGGSSLMGGLSSLFGGSGAAASAVAPISTSGGVGTLGTLAANPLSAYGTGAAGTATSGATAGSTGLGTAGSIGGAVLADAASGAAGYYAGTRAFSPTQAGDQSAENVGGAIGGGVGAWFGGPLGAAAGSFVGTAAGKLENREATAVTNSLGNTAGSLVRYANPLTAIPDSLDKISNLNNTLGIGGGKSDGTGNGDATAGAQRQLDQQTATLNSLKAQVTSGQLSQADYQAQAQPLVTSMTQFIQSLTSRNSAWANAINPQFNTLMASGNVAYQNGQYVAV